MLVILACNSSNFWFWLCAIWTLLKLGLSWLVRLSASRVLSNSMHFSIAKFLDSLLYKINLIRWLGFRFR